MLAAMGAEGGPFLVLARGAADAALLSSFGALLALAWLAPPVLARSGLAGPALARRLRRFAALSVLAAPAMALCWLAAGSAELAGSLGGVPLVLQVTLFGRLIAARLVLLCLAGGALAWRRDWAAASLAGLAVATQAGHGHAWAMHEGPSWLLLSGIVHLVAAAAWLGGLVPLLLLTAAPDAAAFAAQRFARLGTWCVLLLAGTALFQASALVGLLPALTGTAYGSVVLIKLCLFLALVGMAANHRFRLAPQLHAAPGRRSLMRGIAVEAALGLLVVFAAGLLTSLPPAMHEPTMVRAVSAMGQVRTALDE